MRERGEMLVRLRGRGRGVQWILNLADDLLLKWLQCSKQLLGRHLPRDDEAQVVRTIELPVVGTHLQQQEYQTLVIPDNELVLRHL